MNDNDIIRIAQEAANEVGALIPTEWNEPLLERVIVLAAAAEREACLAIVNRGTGEATSADALKILRIERDRISAAIRARSE